MEYSQEGIRAARNGLEHLRHQVRPLLAAGGDSAAEPHPEFTGKFMAAVNNDLNMPVAMAVVQEMLKARIDPAVKRATVLDFERVLGLDLDRVAEEEALPPVSQELIEQRNAARAAKDWALSDRLRDEIQQHGYLVQDRKDGMKVIKR
jgi:cysteinyl-tRNA synthetase